MKNKLEWSCRQNINNLRYADDTILMGENEEELKSLLMKVKEESEKAGLKLNFQKPKIMISGPNTSWQTDWKKMETVTDYFLGLQNHCRWWQQPWNRRCLLLVRKAITNIDSILKSRDITLKVHLVKKLWFSPVVIYGCKSWTIKEADP